MDDPLLLYQNVVDNPSVKKGLLFACQRQICHLLIIFANSLDPYQAWSGSKPFDTLMVFLQKFLEKLILKSKELKHHLSDPEGVKGFAWTPLSGPCF